MPKRGERHVRAEKPQAVRRRPIQERLARGHRDRRFGIVGERPFGVRKRKRVVMDRIQDAGMLVLGGFIVGFDAETGDVASGMIDDGGRSHGTSRQL